MEIKRIFWEDFSVYGADKYGCNKFEIMSNIPSNSFLWFCNARDENVMIADESDVEILKTTADNLHIVNMRLSNFLDSWIHYFGGLELE